MQKIDNKVEIVINYNTDALQETLTEMAEDGYKIVSSVMGLAPRPEFYKGKWDVQAMYLFFTKEDIRY